MPTSQPSSLNEQPKSRHFLATLLACCGLAITLVGFAIGAAPTGASTIPASVTKLSQHLQFGAYGNTTLNDCSMAAIADLQQVWNAELGGSGAPLAQASIVSEYQSLTHNSGQGMYPATTFTAWEQGIDGQRIDSVAPITPNEISVKNTIWQLGGFYAVINITNDNVIEPPSASAHHVATPAWSLSAKDKTSKVSFEPHAVAVVGYNSKYVYIATWGTVQAVTWSWWNARVVDAWAILPHSFVTNNRGPVSTVTSIKGAFFTQSQISTITGPYPS